MDSILVIDDERPILNMFGMLLEFYGFRALTAENGTEGLAIFEKERPKAVFADIKMPGMNGMDLCRKVKGDRPESVIFAVTGYPSIFEISGCLNAGFDDYFSKPVDIGMLTAAIRKAFSKSTEQRRTGQEG